MPEGPEVYSFGLETLNLFHKKQLVHVKICSGKYKKKSFKNYKLLKKILPSDVLSVSTLGKLLLVELKNNYFLVITFGMTGFVTTEQIKHNHIKFVLSDKTVLFYNDMRNFGNIYLLTSDVLYNKILSIGPDILDINFTYKTFKNQLLYYTNKHPTSTNKEICGILLDQNFVSGIGNYLRAEILYHAKINPFTKLNTIANDKKIVKTLYKCIYNVSRYYVSKFVEQNISKFTNLPLNLKKNILINCSYKLKKTPDMFGRVFMVYGEKFDIENNVIKKEKYQGRSIYHVV
jgi:formamidopyrimidine-DNA glycosylase